MTMAKTPRFLFATCQRGAERALKSELARSRPEMAPAYTRPGFLTFKLPTAGRAAESRFDAVFARSWGFSLGKAEGKDPDSLAHSAWELLGRRPCARIHVWQRETREEPDADLLLSPQVVEARRAIVQHCPRPEMDAQAAADCQRVTHRGDSVFDCVLVEPDEWWVGYHRAWSLPSCWPGGIPPLVLPPHAVSRAWLKMQEALLWSGLPIRPGARCAEIGSAPGGASQALLERGLEVLGIDPARMAPEVLAQTNFTHVRRRSNQVRRREFRKIRWLMADMNVAPSYTLTAVQEIVTHRDVNIRGLLLTLKLPDWGLAEQLPQWTGQIRQWGYNIVRARQLYGNRQELCLAALQKPFRRKPFRRR